MSKLYRLLLKQHIGNPATPVVKCGDIVKLGQKIAVVNGLGADLHASVAGVVKEITPDSIFIEGEVSENDRFESIAETDILGRIQAAGIVGMGGAGFPAYTKLSGGIPGGTVIANAAECEPILTHNIVQIETSPQDIYRGLLYAMEVSHAAHGVIAIKETHAKAIAAIKAVIKDERVTVFQLRDLYPMGEERAIVREVLDVLLAPDELPSKANAVVLNVETLSRIAQAVELGKPVFSKNLTVAGRLRGGAKAVPLMDVPIGTRVGDLIDSVGGIDGEYGEIIMGGPFTGHCVIMDDVITKTTGGIIVTMPFLKEKRKMGLLVCACGANESRMQVIACKMGAEVVAVERCKQAVEVRGTLKCLNPGNCPGQAEKVLHLKKAGAEVILIGNCSDCSNTVMAIAPKLHMPVYHITDGSLRAMNLHLIRKLSI